MGGLWCHWEYDRRLTVEEAIREDFYEEVTIELRARGLAGPSQAKKQGWGWGENPGQREENVPRLLLRRSMGHSKN